MSNTKDMLKLAAAKLLEQDASLKEHRKQAHALRLLYKQAEMGCGEFPRSYNELQSKIASLLNQDLQVYEKALELNGGNIKLGELDRNVEPSQFNSSEQFRAMIIDG